MLDSGLVSVPWISTAEWCLVRDELFSAIPSKQRHAIDRIDAWRSKSPRSLPVAIICTVDLMRVALMDQCRSQELVNFEETGIRLAYSMALVRFINLATELLQKKTAQAIHMLAGEMGLPEWLVNIRHEATHYALPSMDLLRNGVSVALEWLKITYWDEQSKDIDLVSDLPSVFGEKSSSFKLRIEGEKTESSRDDKAIEAVDEDSIDWRSVPLGVLPGQALSYHSLELPECVDSLDSTPEVVDVPTLSFYWQEDE